MPGVRIALSADEANAALQKFRNNLKATGADALKTEKEVAQLEKKMLANANQNKIKNSFDELTKSMGLTRTQAKYLAKDLHLDPNKVLPSELGTRTKSMTGMWMKLGGAILTAGIALNKFKNLMKEGINLIDQYQVSAISMAAMWTGMQEPRGRSIGEIYKEAKVYADQLLLTMEQIDKETLLNANDLRQITTEMTKQGVILDINNKKEVDGFKAVANALAVVSAGAPNKEIQLRQEIRALMLGQARVTDQLGMMLKAQIPDLEKQLKLHKEQGDLFEYLGEQLIGFQAAQGDINATWEATKSSLETIYNKVLREGFGGAYKDIIAYTKQLSQWALDHKEEIQDILSEGWDLIKIVAGSLVDIYQSHQTELAAIYKGVMKIVYGWEFIFIETPNWILAIQDGLRGLAKFAQGSWEAASAISEGRLIKGYKAGKQALKDLVAKGDRIDTTAKLDALYNKLIDLEYGKKKNTIGSVDDPFGARPGQGPKAPKLRNPPDEDAAKAAKKIEDLNQKIQDDLDDMTMSSLQKAYKQAREWKKEGASKAKVDEWLSAKEREIEDKDTKELNEQLAKVTKDRLKDEQSIKETRQEYENKSLAVELKIADAQRAIRQEMGEINEVEAIQEKADAQKQILDGQEKILLIKMQEASLDEAELMKLYKEYEMLRKEQDTLQTMTDLEKELQRIKNKKEAVNNLGYYDTEGFAQFKKDEVDKVTKKMKEAGLEEEAIAEYTADQIKSIEIEKNQFIIAHSKDVAKVLKAQTEIWKKEQKNFAQLANDAFVEATGYMKETMSEFINDAFNGELKKGTDYFQSFTKSINKMFADMISEWASKKLMGSLFGNLFGGGGGGNNYTFNDSGGSGWLGTIISGVTSLFGGMFRGSGGSTSFNSPSGLTGDVDSGYYDALGDIWRSGRVVPFGRGAVVDGPTSFPMADGRTGIMGEKGFEAIMPLARTSTGELGVKGGGGSSSLTVSVPININGNVQDSGALQSALRSEVEEAVERVVRRMM